MGRPIDAKSLTIACALWVFWSSGPIASGEDILAPAMQLADGEWFIRIEHFGHEPQAGRTELYSSGQIKKLRTPNKRGGAPWQELFVGQVPKQDLRDAYQAAQKIVRDFSLANQARPSSGRDDDAEREFTFATANGSYRLWFRSGEQLRDQRLTDDLNRWFETLNRSLPGGFQFVRLRAPFAE